MSILRVEEGRILGLIGPNGAGKTTALDAILGLTSYEGELTVLGRDPWSERDRAHARRLLSLPTSPCCPAGCGFRSARLCRRRASAIRSRESGRFSGQDDDQAHEQSAGNCRREWWRSCTSRSVMAIDAKLLVLDEPTLGLDILYRKQFYDSLLNDYFDGSRTIVVTTHQVEEIQDVLTDLMFINHGRIVLECSMEEFESRYVEVMVHPGPLARERGRSSRCTSARSSVAASCFSKTSIAANSPPSATSVRPASPICSSRSWVTRKDQRNESADRMQRSEVTSEIQNSPIPRPSATRPLYWSVRRELWENRSIYIAPLIAAGVVLFGFVVTAFRLPGAQATTPCRSSHALSEPRSRCRTISRR